MIEHPPRASVCPFVRPYSRSMHFILVPLPPLRQSGFPYPNQTTALYSAVDVSGMQESVLGFTRDRSSHHLLISGGPSPNVGSGSRTLSDLARISDCRIGFGFGSHQVISRSSRYTYVVSGALHACTVREIPLPFRIGLNSSLHPMRRAAAAAAFSSEPY